MRSMVTVSKMDERSIPEISTLFTAFDSTEIPELIGLRRRQLFVCDGIQIHLYDFADQADKAALMKVKGDPRMARLSADLEPYVSPYEPETWNSPADSAAFSFYDWEDGSTGDETRTDTTVTLTRMDQDAIPAVTSVFQEFDATGGAGAAGTRRRQLFAYNDLCVHIQDHVGPDGGDVARKAAAELWFGKVVEALPRLAPEGPSSDGHASRFYGWEAP
ncbi:TcmI family type II polyketide cyclase [Streptomyces sp. CC224B]|uniref:TcmI family type II polyketide cyclase n=1 Tax=Streptomyces sp. CC224B TaxID=3044571 RepID=UPI0024A7E4FB|nr:TcmI family type II polyketide cyclase [Streptomyces sp. CC224B]